MIVFYDFDGTLTPYPIPQYEILKKCNVNYEEFFNNALEMTQKMHVSIYDAFYDTFKTLLMENGFSFNKDVVSLGSEDVVFSKGVMEFLPALKMMGIKQYVITSGYKDFVLKTSVAKYLDGVFGTEFEDDDLDGNLDKILTDEDKAVIIKNICDKDNIPYNKILYLGDGLTDKDAFAFVHKKGGKAIFIGEKNDNYETLSSYNIIDECFARNFTLDSELFTYIENFYKENK